MRTMWGLAAAAGESAAAAPRAARDMFRSMISGCAYSQRSLASGPARRVVICARRVHRAAVLENPSLAENNGFSMHHSVWCLVFPMKLGLY